MFQWLIELLQELQQKSNLEQLGYVLGGVSAVVSTIAGAALGYRRLVRRKYARMQEEYEELSAKRESYQLRIKDLKAEIADCTGTIDTLRARVPEFQLEIADKERLENNDTKTIHILTDLYADIRPSISSCCFQLGQYHLALYVDNATAAHLDEADRLVRISSLLEPERKDVRDLLGEIEAIRADSAARAGDHQTADGRWDMAFDYVGEGLGGQGMTLVEQLHEKAHARRREGLFSTSAILLRRAAKLATAHVGPEHPDTLTMRRSLGSLYVQTGRYGEAEPLLKEVLATQEQELGPDDPDTLQTRHDLASLYVKMGRYEEAEPLLKEVLAKREQKLGADHPDTLTTRHNLAWLSMYMGRYQEAEPLLKEVLATQERKLGADHPDTLITRHNLALLYVQMGRYQEAEPLLKEVIATQERKLGADHPDTLTHRHNLAWLYVYLRRDEEAEPLLKEVLATQERKLGLDHPDTLTTRDDLASLYVEMGRYEEAEPLLKEVLAKREQKLGLDHPGTLTTRHLQASLYVHMGRYEEAEPLLREVLAKRQQKLGADHPDTKDPSAHEPVLRAFGSQVFRDRGRPVMHEGKPVTAVIVLE